MKKFNLLLGGLMAIAFTACTNEDFMQEGNSNAPSAEKITITAYTPGDNSASSRIAQGDYEIDQTIPLTWDNNDQISVYYAGITKTYTKSGEDKNTFTGDPFTEVEGFYYGFYPALAANVVDGNVPFDLSDQTGADTYLMCARSEVHNSYQFSHAAAYLKATFTFPAEANVSDATITLTVPEGVYTKGTINLTDGTLNGSNKNAITKKVNFTESTEVWFALPPMTAGDNTLKFRVSTANETYIGTLSGTQAILAGCYYDAAVSLTNAAVCELPKLSGYFDSTNFNINNSYNSVIFEVNSNKPTSGNGVVKIGSSGAYAKIENNNIYIYTKADEFKFKQDASMMFWGNSSCFKNVKKIIFGNGINTLNVKNMSQMFDCCFKLESIDFGNNFDTSNVTNMSYMFSACCSLQTLDLSSFNTANVTNMSNMFNIFYSGGSYQLSSIIFGDNFTTENVMDMSSMFKYCKNLNPLDLCKFTFKSGVALSNMFSECGNTTVYVKNSSDESTLEWGSRKNGEYIKVCPTHGQQPS